MDAMGPKGPPVMRAIPNNHVSKTTVGFNHRPVGRLAGLLGIGKTKLM